MKFNGAAAPGCAEVACSVAAGVGSAVFWRGGPLSFSLCTYSVRMIKNCPVELAISFKTLRAAGGAALNVKSTTLRSTKFAALLDALGSAAFCPGARVLFRAEAGVGFGGGVDEGPCSAGKGAR